MILVYPLLLFNEIIFSILQLDHLYMFMDSIVQNPPTITTIYEQWKLAPSNHKDNKTNPNFLSFTKKI
jgi:hypothetical protein